MKKILSLFILFVFSNSFSQIVFPPLGCGTNIIYHGNNFNRSATPVIPDNPLTPLVLNVAFTMINDAPNHNGANLTTNEAVEERFLLLIKYLNINYNKHNMFFKYNGFKVVENAVISGTNYQYIIFQGNPNPPYIENNIAQYKVENSMNVYCIDGLLANTAPVGGDFIILNSPMLSTSAIESGNQTEHVISHEMGHCLSLYHTFELGGSHFIQTHPLFSLTQCEHVTRQTDNPRYNADIAGDEVADTPATPLTNSSMFEPNCGAYIFDVNRHDCDTPVSTPYENILIGNVMNYGSFECDDSFTAGQVKRMREFILNNTYLYGGVEIPGSSSNGTILDARNTVESLYKPYATGKLIFPDPVSTSENGDGTIKVCRNYNSANYKFQPGFTYTFLEEPDANAPILASATVDTFPVLVVQPAFNCPVRIAELAPGQTNLTTNIGQAETICRGQECVNEPLFRGEDIKVKILGSMNYTIEQLDKIQVKDPELYEKLMSEYYHILKMYTESGAKVEKVIYKP
jgi:Pregnancy-associated plasma protein-A